ncbi:MAG: hypothetical protein IGS54_10775 [Elainella sp. C42_A2020_010]|nr:hypothetical protein [Elainella sp. C42_A2020_010]RNJ65435.1 MAG: hypothetical protein EDM05_31110 [Leptolyngbya sp. IPPAS B-1204]
MTDFDEPTDIQDIQLDSQAYTQRAVVQRQRHSPWFWLVLVAGSVVLHGLAIHWVRAATLQALLQTPPETATPIDWVELPAAATADTKSAQPQPVATPPQTTAAANSQAGKTAAKSLSKPQSVVSASVAATSSAAIQTHIPNAVSAQPLAAAPADEAPSSTQPANQSASQSTSQSASSLTEEQTSALGEQQISQPTPTASTASAASAASELAASRPTVQVPQPSLAQPTSSPPASPLIVTQQIDVPVPDVSGTMPIPTENREERAGAVTDQVPIPSHLTASLTTDPLPATDHSTEPDETAQPKTEVKTFPSHPTVSPCEVTPEAVQFLGKTVAMRVATDETGQVVRTVTHESSDSRAYDELATCLVKNWSFEPAIAGGEPVADDKLLVRITIDRSGDRG